MPVPVSPRIKTLESCGAGIDHPFYLSTQNLALQWLVIEGFIKKYGLTFVTQEAGEEVLHKNHNVVVVHFSKLKGLE